MFHFQVNQRQIDQYFSFQLSKSRSRQSYFHDNMQDCIRDRKDSLQTKEVRESTERVLQYSSEKVIKIAALKKQQKRLHRQRQSHSIQSDSSVG